jgi:hypothetical protein
MAIDIKSLGGGYENKEETATLKTLALFESLGMAAILSGLFACRAISISRNYSQDIRQQ